jgi:Transposase DDE domain
VTVIHAYTPSPDVDHRTEFFSADRFRYEAERDVYLCPAGKELRFDRPHSTERSRRYRARAKDCNHCPLKAQCTTSQQGRTLCRSVDEEYLDRVRAYQSAKSYQKALRKRSVWVEPLFAAGKDWHGMRRFRLRELWRVNCEAVLIAAGQNLKRLLKKRGWGRHPFPAEALNAFFGCFWVRSSSVFGRAVLFLATWLRALKGLKESHPYLMMSFDGPFFNRLFHCTTLSSIR